jgi:protoporphyrinogen oxidase
MSTPEPSRKEGAGAHGAEITKERPVLALGGGPAGLTAGYLLAKAGKPVIVLESTGQVGGIARTEVRDGYRFDLGGHRFFTKAKEVDDLWHEIMKEEFLRRPRQSRIYWRGKFLEYPLQGMDVIRKLGPIELTRCLLSYLWAAAKPKGREDTFEAWVSNRFGKRLYGHFFKSYSEKVWGVPADEIRAEWAAQRIKGLSFFSAAKSAFFGNRGNKIKSLISAFNYPRYGPGQMWEQMTDDIQAHGGEVRLNSPVTRIRMDGGRVVEVVAGGETITPSHVISSLPLRTTVGIADPEAQGEVRDAARGLRYRDFLTVALVIEGEDLFPDNWIYIHDPRVRVGRIQNFRSWSPWMVPNETDASIGMEYFCFEGDDLWTMSDDDLVALATREIQELGLARAEKVKFGFAVRVHKAYPMYDAEYSERVATIRGWLEGIENLQQVGRNGLHRYNNSDHSMLTAMRAVDNILLGTHHDLWAVNAESVYHEEDVEDEQPYVDAPETPAMEQPLASER